MLHVICCVCYIPYVCYISYMFMLYAVCYIYMLFAVSYMLYMLYVTYVLCCMLCVVCCMLYVVRYLLYIICYISYMLYVVCYVIRYKLFTCKANCSSHSFMTLQSSCCTVKEFSKSWSLMTDLAWSCPSKNTLLLGRGISSTFDHKQQYFAEVQITFLLLQIF